MMLKGSSFEILTRSVLSLKGFVPYGVFKALAQDRCCLWLRTPSPSG